MIAIGRIKNMLFSVKKTQSPNRSEGPLDKAVKFLSKENSSNYFIYSYKHEKLREVTFFDRLFKIQI